MRLTQEVKMANLLIITATKLVIANAFQFSPHSELYLKL